MTTEKRRDLYADLAICDAATPGPWEWLGGELIEERTKQLIPMSCSDGAFILESREGWPEAIRRAIAAEAEIERLRKEIDHLHWQRESLEGTLQHYRGYV